MTPEQEEEYGQRLARITKDTIPERIRRTDINIREKIAKSIENGHTTSGEIAKDLGSLTPRVCMTLKRMLDCGEVRVVRLLKRPRTKSTRVYEVMQ